MRTLDLAEAASFLRIHPVTLCKKAAAGKIPGARIGRRWVFIEDDLAAYLRAHYAPQALQDDIAKGSRSVKAQTYLPSGLNSLTAATRYREALGLPNTEEVTRPLTRSRRNGKRSKGWA